MGRLLLDPAPHVECPRCRRKLLPWASLRSDTEEFQWRWDPDAWWVPLPLPGLLFLVIGPMVLPVLGLLAFGVNLTLLAGTGLSFVWAFAVGWLAWGVRRRRLAQLASLRGDDLVCPNCLHSPTVTRT